MLCPVFPAVTRSSPDLAIPLAVTLRAAAKLVQGRGLLVLGGLTPKRVSFALSYPLVQGEDRTSGLWLRVSRAVRPLASARRASELELAGGPDCDVCDWSATSRARRCG